MPPLPGPKLHFLKYLSTPLFALFHCKSGPLNRVRNTHIIFIYNFITSQKCCLSSQNLASKRWNNITTQLFLKTDFFFSWSNYFNFFFKNFILKKPWSLSTILDKKALQTLHKFLYGQFKVNWTNTEANTMTSNTYSIFLLTLISPMTFIRLSLQRLLCLPSLPQLLPECLKNQHLSLLLGKAGKDLISVTWIFLTLLMRYIITHKFQLSSLLIWTVNS